MARPVKKRRICGEPTIRSFSPACDKERPCVELTMDEYETIRLIDYMHCSQKECAEQMNVARTTVQAIYDTARKKMATVLVEGASLKIVGGVYEICKDADTCCHKTCRGSKKCCCGKMDIGI